MHDAAFNFVAGAVPLVPPGCVLEIGSRNINGSVRQLFAEWPYVGIDVVPGQDVNQVADGATYRPSYAPSTILCCEVLEHAPNAKEICRNVHRILAPGGLFIVTAAGEGRPPHSSVDGGPLRGDEFYANVNATMLHGWLADFTDVHIIENQQAKDIYATARKPR